MCPLLRLLIVILTYLIGFTELVLQRSGVRWCLFSLQIRTELELMMHAMLDGLLIQGIKTTSKLKDT